MVPFLLISRPANVSGRLALTSTLPSSAGVRRPSPVAISSRVNSAAVDAHSSRLNPAVLRRRPDGESRSSRSSSLASPRTRIAYAVTVAAIGAVEKPSWSKSHSWRVMRPFRGFCDRRWSIRAPSSRRDFPPSSCRHIGALPPAPTGTSSPDGRIAVPSCTTERWVAALPFLTCDRSDRRFDPWPGIESLRGGGSPAHPRRFAKLPALPRRLVVSIA